MCDQIDDSMNTECQLSTSWYFGIKLIERGNLFALGFCHFYVVVLVRLRSYDDSAHSFDSGSGEVCVLLFFFVIMDHGH